MDRLQAEWVTATMQDNTMERVVLPFSGLASWVLILGGMLATLQVLGINIQPLLTVGGVSGIVVGLSAQSVMSNMISGINLVSAWHNSMPLVAICLPCRCFLPLFTPPFFQHPAPADCGGISRNAVGLSHPPPPPWSPTPPPFLFLL